MKKSRVFFTCICLWLLKQVSPPLCDLYLSPAPSLGNHCTNHFYGAQVDTPCYHFRLFLYVIWGFACPFGNAEVKGKRCKQHGISLTWSLTTLVSNKCTCQQYFSSEPLWGLQFCIKIFFTLRKTWKTGPPCQQEILVLLGTSLWLGLEGFFFSFFIWKLCSIENVLVCIVVRIFCLRKLLLSFSKPEYFCV